MGINSPQESEPPMSKAQAAGMADQEYKELFSLSADCSYEDLISAVTAKLKVKLEERGLQKSDEEIRNMAESHRINWLARREGALLGYEVM